VETLPTYPTESPLLPNQPLLSTPLPAQPYSQEWQNEVNEWQNEVQESRKKLMDTRLMQNSSTSPGLESQSK
jgi:hypothetical protein